MIAKCGQHIVWHWAHKSRRNCDPWQEPETEWHRSWKDCFPADWQEVVHTDPMTGERHIADIKSLHGLVIEIQNSPIHLEELKSRERFYKKMVWIVNGDRRGADGQPETLDKSYFHFGRSSDPIRTDPLAFAVEWYGKSKLLHKWSEATRDVYFDFGDGLRWKLDSFDPRKTISQEIQTRVETKPDHQGDLLPKSGIERHARRQSVQRTVSLGEFIPIRTEDFVDNVTAGNSVEGTFGREEASIFKKRLVRYSDLVDNE